MERWYFAFGANMSTRLFVERRGMKPSASQRAILRDWELGFFEPGLFPFIEPAYASIEPRTGSSVHGILYRLPASDFETLDLSESSNYRRETFEVEGVETGIVEALAYRSVQIVEDAKPSRRYLQLLVEGAREHELPEHYVRWLENHDSAYVPLASEIFSSLAPTYLRLRERGVRPEVLWFKLRERLKK